MAVQNYDYYPIVDPDTYLNEQQEKLTAEQFEKNKQKLLSGIASVGYDVSPVVGEIRSLQYAQDEAKNLVENVLSGNPDKLKMVAQGAGIGLGILGAIPIVGYGTRLVNRGLQKAFEAFGPGAKAEEAVARTEGRSTIDVAQSLHEGLLTRDPLFQTFLRGLPEYRRTTYADNIREYENLSQTQRQSLLGNNLDNVVNGSLLRTQSVAVQAEKTAQQEQKNIITKFEEAKNKSTKGQLITTTNEPRTFGEGTIKNLGEKQKNVREFIGSESYDIIAASNIAKATPQQWIGYLTNARQKGVKPEELEDAGLLILNSKGEPIGGELFNILKQNPKETITKQEILASIETNPAFNMKVMDYEYPIKETFLLEKFPNLRILNTDAQRILNEKIFQIQNVAERAPVLKTIEELQSISNVDSRVARTLEIADPKQYREISDKLNQIATTLPQNQSQVFRTLADDYSAFAKMNEDALKTKNLVPIPRHNNPSQRPPGGYDYREKVIYYDNPIPDNSDLKRVYSIHFNEPNPPVFTRYDTRGVDSYGDTFFIFEMQSDPHQSISKKFRQLNLDEKAQKEALGTSEKMVRNNPFGTKIQNEINKRERQTILEEQKILTDKAEKTPLTNKEMGRLIELDSNLKMLNMRTMTRPADFLSEKQLQDLVDKHYQRQFFDKKNLVYDYFPMGKESTWVKLGLKSIINSAQRESKRYVALAPAEFFQLPDKTKFKIEQFYGLGLEKGALQGKFAPRNPELTLKEQKVFLGGPEGLGKYRKNTRITEGEKKQHDEAWYPGELAGDAVLPKAAKEIVKEMGGNIVSKKVYLTDPTKPYKILERGKPSYAFKTKLERDTTLKQLLTRESGLKEMDIFDSNDPSNFVWSVVIDTQGMKKTPSKGYRYGGLVQAKREFFAPLF
jgi:hypothetical protein